MISHGTAGWLLVGLAVVALLGGCATGATPSPSPTASLDVMPGSSHAYLGTAGWPVFLAAFPKAAAKD